MLSDLNTLDQVLGDSEALELLAEHAANRVSIEVVHWCRHLSLVRQLARHDGPSEKRQDPFDSEDEDELAQLVSLKSALELAHLYIRSGARFELNISAENRRSLVQLLDQEALECVRQARKHSSEGNARFDLWHDEPRELSKKYPLPRGSPAGSPRNLQRSHEESNDEFLRRAFCRGGALFRRSVSRELQEHIDELDQTVRKLIETNLMLSLRASSEWHSFLKRRAERLERLRRPRGPPPSLRQAVKSKAFSKPMRVTNRSRDSLPSKPPKPSKPSSKTNESSMSNESASFGAAFSSFSLADMKDTTLPMLANRPSFYDAEALRLFAEDEVPTEEDEPMEDSVAAEVSATEELQQKPTVSEVKHAEQPQRPYTEPPSSQEQHHRHQQEEAEQQQDEEEHQQEEKERENSVSALISTWESRTS
ncbi:MAG: hypothetical protein MHM6MM_000182 [Cercozoa sp. M6MM]